jgi:hypothetical protein
MTTKHQLACSDIENSHNDNHKNQHFKKNFTCEEHEQLQTIPTTTTTASSKYYEYLNSTTKEGKLFNTDFSSEPDVPEGNLTEKEIKERTAHYDTLQKLYEHYNTALQRHPVCTTKEDVLQQRIVAPHLTTGKVSSRGALNEKKVGGLYPPTINEWKEFESDVENYNLNHISTPCLPWSIGEVFMESLTRATFHPIISKDSEQYELVDNLSYLQEADIVKSVGAPDGHGFGHVDFYVMKDERVATILCVFKATHDLLLPMNAIDCVTKYNNAFKEMSIRNISSIEDPTLEWSTTAQPLGQLIAYLVDNTMYYGSLTSGTRTYFVKIQSANVTIATKCQPQLQVYITNAWFVGQVNYLRAWAYVHHLGDVNTQQRQQQQPCVTPFPPTTWMYSTVKFAAPNHRSTGFDSSSGSTDPLYSMLPRANFNDIQILSVLGTGRNGVCFKVMWNHTKYAMKQFDILQHGTKYFRHELEAYMILKDSWGDLVPQPVFTSQSYTGGVQFFGLQLGQEPNEFVNDYYSMSYKILERLRMEYGICHNDAEDRNMIMISDKCGIKKMVAIDFESWDYV